MPGMRQEAQAGQLEELRAAHAAASTQEQQPMRDAHAAELEDPSLSADDMECEARVVTELKDTVNNASLPDRFMMAMRAMRGEFSPSSGDTERDDGQILEAMVDFPADIDLKVVSQSLPAAEQQDPLLASG